MEEILFRGKRKDNGEWVYGYLFVIWEKHYILWGTTNDVPNMIEVIPETVGQWIKLQDNKMDNIFEGDVVHSWGGEYCQGYWEHNNTFVISSLTNPFDIIEITESENIDIVGNIYDNPELVETTLSKEEEK